MHAHSCLPDAYQLVTLLDNYTHGPVTRVICTSLLVQDTFVFDMSLKRLQVSGHLIEVPQFGCHPNFQGETAPNSNNTGPYVEGRPEHRSEGRVAGWQGEGGQAR